MKKILFIVALITLFIGCWALSAWLLMLAVNWLLGSFGVGFALSFWQTLIIEIILATIGGFFKSKS